MVEVYTKSPLTFEQQLQQLKDRGLIIDNNDFALSQLRTISYYRLSAYWHPFRKKEQDGTISGTYEEGTHFNEVIMLYEFDRRLRLLVMRKDTFLWSRDVFDYYNHFSKCLLSRSRSKFKITRNIKADIEKMFAAALDALEVQGDPATVAKRFIDGDFIDGYYEAEHRLCSARRRQ